MLEYAIQMRLRGDTYRDMLNYLNRHTNDDTIIKDIISKVDNLEKGKRIKAPERGRSSISSLSAVLGVIFIVAGIALIFFLWDKGFIASLPIILIIIGFTALSGRLG